MIGYALYVGHHKMRLKKSIKGGMMKAIKIAIKTETDAIAFYKEAAEKTRHPYNTSKISEPDLQQYLF